MNQCQGCQAGWPIVQSQFGKVHKVEGGYRNEIVACTKTRYKEEYEKAYEEAQRKVLERAKFLDW